jgi:geranylgeranyl pyrophosphate synthase
MGTGEPYELKGSSTVREGDDEKGLKSTSSASYFIWTGGKVVRPYLSVLLTKIAQSDRFSKILPGLERLSPSKSLSKVYFVQHFSS